ncbi:MAG: hypothetical protein M3279_12140 [Actinomycetota bacterium]|nr:hypothetical protein [Actinomycetota bacterium]
MRSFRLRALAALSVLGLVVAAPTASGGPPGRWTKIGNPSVNFAQPGMARTSDGTLHLVWVRETAGNAAADDVVHTSIAAGGTAGSTDVVQSAWASAWPVPDLVLTPDGGLRAFWGGIRSTASNEEHTNISTATAPSSGPPWTLHPGDVSEGAGGSASSIGAATAADGTPLFAFGGGHVHRGVDPSTPNHPFDVPGPPGCCNYDPDLATDDATGEMWLAWYSNQNDFEGIWAQEVDPATGEPTGTPARMPGSFTIYNGSDASSQEIQRTPIAAREGGGVFVASSSGYPSTMRILVWKVGETSSTAVARSGSRELVNPGIAADPEGRLWVVWSQVDASGRPVTFARRSNLDATRWGAVIRIRPPRALGDCNSLFSLTPAAQSSSTSWRTSPTGAAEARWRSGTPRCGPG